MAEDAVFSDNNLVQSCSRLREKRYIEEGYVPHGASCALLSSESLSVFNSTLNDLDHAHL